MSITQPTEQGNVVQVYVFSSSNLTNIWAGVGARLWAVSETQAANASLATRSRDLPIGALGLLYCVETQAFTVPFLIRSKPDPVSVISDVWPERWRLPFHIVPLGTPRRRLPKDRLALELPGLSASGREWYHTFHIQGLTAFAASELDDRDWQVIIDRLADV
jgi:hypothetical protein